MGKIAGIIARNTLFPGAQPLGKMLRSMEHKAGSKVGSWHSRPLGSRIGWISEPGDPEPVRPIWNESTNILLIVEGEIFPSDSEISALRAKGHEVPGQGHGYLVHDYEENGAGFLERINGRFCGFMVDLRKNLAILFNDRFGMGRLYFSETSEAIYFASEAKALLAVLPETRSFDEQALAEYLSLGCPLRNRSLFRNISLFPSASNWQFSPQMEVKRNTYFSREEWETQLPIAPRDCVEAFNEVFDQSIQRRLKQNSPQAALSLTGGLDSRMVMAWARPKPGTLPCFTFGGPYRDCADVCIAKRIAAVSDQPHTTIRVGLDFFKQFSGLAQECIYLTDGIAEVWGAVELHVNRLAARIAPVRLTGNYGSEILRSSIAFRPRNLNWKMFSPDFQPLLRQAAESYDQELQCNRLSFIAFKQVPWYHYALFSLERSALIPRSPFLDTELVRLAYRAPLFFSVGKILELIRARAPQLGALQTDRAYQDGRRLPIIPALARIRQELTVRAEYAYDYGMPAWAVKADRLLAPLHLEQLFLGRHKFYHYRVWYRDQLGPQVKALALELCDPPSCYRQGAVPEMVKDHLSGRANHTRELHKLLSVQLMEKLLLKKLWDT